MTPPRRRWYHYGEPWGLLSKANATATARSVMRRALTVAATSAGLYGTLLYFRTDPTPDWQIKVSIWATMCGLSGALFEWQVAADDAV